MRYTYEGTGTRPLLMHNERLANPLDPFAIKIKTITSKRIKTVDDVLTIARIEWEGGLYFSEEIGPFVPARNIHAMLCESAKRTRSGKDVTRGLQLAEDTDIPLLYNGPRDLAGMWGGGEDKSEFVDVRMIKVSKTSGRTRRCRPMFRQWGFTAELDIDPTFLNPTDFERIAVEAGITVGLGDYRQIYGRFEGKVIRTD